MPRVVTLAAGSPASSMRIDIEKPTAAWQPASFSPSFASTDLSGSLDQRLIVRPHDLGSSPKRLTPAGLVAMVDAIDTYYGGLSAANRDLLFGRMVDPGIQVTDKLVSFPVVAADAAAMVTTLAAIVNTGANVVAF